MVRIGRCCVNCKYWSDYQVGVFPMHHCTSAIRGVIDEETGEYICWEPADEEKEKV